MVRPLIRRTRWPAVSASAAAVSLFRSAAATMHRHTTRETVRFDTPTRSSALPSAQQGPGICRWPTLEW